MSDASIRARVYFDKEHRERPWLIAYDNGRVSRAEWVSLSGAQTDFDNDGFMDLPNGPKAVITGYVQLTRNEVNAFGAPA